MISRDGDKILTMRMYITLNFVN